MQEYPIVLNFSGHDTAGLAGLSADLRVQAAMKVHSANVITANTAQNNQGLMAINPLSESVFQSQCDAVSTLPIKVIKLGLLASERQVEIIAQLISAEKIFNVIDPVLATSSGANCSFDLIQAYKTHLFPYCSLLTPNIPEAEALTGLTLDSPEQVERAGSRLLAMGIQSVLIKGGHADLGLEGFCADFFMSPKRKFWLFSKKNSASSLRGTGCTLASAVSSAYAQGYSLEDAIVIGKMHINQGIRQAYTLGQSHGNTLSFTGAETSEDLPSLWDEYPATINDKPFPDCGDKPLGLYPVVERAEWIQKLAASGVSTMQLRVKDLEGEALEKEIQQAIHFGKVFNCRLFINDYWQLAIKHQAYGVHLGQEDLSSADIAQIYQAGLRLGLSTHCHYEVARAHAYQPSYIACGPVYKTYTKDMPWIPQGIDGLNYWRRLLHYPLVAIGGINEQRIDQVVAAGVDSVAMITAITEAKDPVATATDFVQRCRSPSQ